jgi:hypothetical protein
VDCVKEIFTAHDFFDCAKFPLFLPGPWKRLLFNVAPSLRVHGLTPAFSLVESTEFLW